MPDLDAALMQDIFNFGGNSVDNERNT